MTKELDKYYSCMEFIQNCRAWLIHLKAVLPFIETSIGWRV